MRFPSCATLSSRLVAAATFTSAFPAFPLEDRAPLPEHLQDVKRQDVPIPFLPAEATGLKTTTTPRGVTIRYKEPGKSGICETTRGVNSYSGYIDLAEDVHVFFWFFESRRDPANDNLTFWMNGGPGSDSILGLFDELGPCRITDNLATTLNPWSFSNMSNLLFLSQPVGVGLSYQDSVVSSISNITGVILPQENTPRDSVVPLGRYGVLNSTGEHTIDTTDAAAIAGWELVQGFISGIESFGGKAGKPKTFNLWAESYGGHWGPAFLDYFYEQNKGIANGTVEGHSLEFGTLGLVNPFVDALIQDPWGPEFAVNKNFGIVGLNESQYEYAKLAMEGPMGCATQIEICKLAAQSAEGGYVDGFIIAAAAADAGVNGMCSKAQNMCRDNVELPFVYFSGRGTYDIRRPSLDPTPPVHLKPFLDQAEIQEAIGVSLNYSGTSKIEVFNEFQRTGDWVFPNSLRHIEKLLEYGVRVSLVYGDADYFCNWHGGEALSKAIKHKNAAQFAAAGYQPLEYDGTRYGDVREYGNLSFVRVYDAGHLVQVDRQ